MLCLLRSPRACPFVVVHDDREKFEGHKLSQPVLARLRGAMRAGDELVALTSLFARFPGGAAAFRKEQPYIGMDVCPQQPPPYGTPHGRRLYEMSEYTMPEIITEQSGGDQAAIRRQSGGPHGRRLYEMSEYTMPWLKLWLWAVPGHEHLLYVDAGVLEHAPHACMHVCIQLTHACALHVYTGRRGRARAVQPRRAAAGARAPAISRDLPRSPTFADLR